MISNNFDRSDPYRDLGDKKTKDALICEIIIWTADIAVIIFDSARKLRTTLSRANVPFGIGIAIGVIAVVNLILT
jgi:uncharacterized membrane protein (DUF485 family)